MADNTTGVKWNKVNFVRENGVVSLDATLAAMRVEATEFLASNVADMAGVAEAVDSVFARMGEAANKQIELNALALKAYHSMTVKSGKETMMLDAIKRYVRSESDLFKATAGEVGKYIIATGTGGGVRNSSPDHIAKFKAIAAKKNVETLVL